MTDVENAAPAPARWRPGPLELLPFGLIVLVLGQRMVRRALPDPAPGRPAPRCSCRSWCRPCPSSYSASCCRRSSRPTCRPPSSPVRCPRDRRLRRPRGGDAAGVVLPGCECASVPVAGGLMSRGVTPAAALAFLLSSPAINPVVIVSTFVAFPNNREMAVAAVRCLAGHRCDHGLAVAALRASGEWLRVPSRLAPRGCHAGGDVPAYGVPRLPARGRLPRDRRAHGRCAQRARPGELARGGGRPSGARGASRSRPRRGAVDLLGGRRLRRGVAHAVLAHGQARLPGRRADDRPQARSPCRRACSVAGSPVRFAPTTFVVAVLVASLVGWWLW